MRTGRGQPRARCADHGASGRWLTAAVGQPRIGAPVRPRARLTTASTGPTATRASFFLMVRRNALPRTLSVPSHPPSLLAMVDRHCARPKPEWSRDRPTDGHCGRSVLFLGIAPFLVRSARVSPGSGARVRVWRPWAPREDQVEFQATLRGSSPRFATPGAARISRRPDRDVSGSIGCAGASRTGGGASLTPSAIYPVWTPRVGLQKYRRIRLA